MAGVAVSCMKMFCPRLAYSVASARLTQGYRLGQFRNVLKHALCAPNPSAEVMREQQRELNRTERSLQRDRAKLEQQEKQLVWT